MEQTLDKTIIVQNTETEVTNVNFKTHTVILLVGPSGAGKTSFANGYLIPGLKANTSGEKKINVQYIGSDAIRRELLDDPDMDKMAKEMIYVSEQAFDTLFNRLKNAVSYPVNSEFVIIDTTGLNKDFRDQVIKISRDNGYNVSAILFDYKNRKDYYENIKDGSEDIRVTTRHIDTFKNTTIREIGKKDYDVIVKVKSRNFDKYNIVVENYREYNEHYLPFGPEYVIFGDIHGCYDEFIELLGKHNFEVSSEGRISHIENKKIVLVGDIIDKGYGIEKMIDLVHKNIDQIYMVLGNHENFVYKYISGLIDLKTAPSKEVIDEYFNTIYLLQDNEELKNKFLEIVWHCKGFFIHRDFIVTHAPCQTKYLGKLSGFALKAQRDYKYPKHQETQSDQEYIDVLQKEFEFLRKQAVRNHPYHIFGHIMTARSNGHFNKVNIDTGCVAGNRLTSVVVNPNGRLFFIDVSSAGNTNVKKEKLVNFFAEKAKKEIDFSDLEPREKGRMFHTATNKVNFISGTVCPADKNLEAQDLECLDKAFEYYEKNGITKLVLQPKYMGSRANVYLFKDSSRNYTATRNGYIIKQIDLTEAYKPLYDIPYIKNKFDNDKMELIILDAELLPWSAIGKGLIQKDFFTIEEAIKSEVSYLKENGFEEVLSSFYGGQYKESGYEIASHKASRSEMKEQYGENMERLYRSVKQFMRSYITIESIEENLSVFSKQLELFGGDGEPNFKPFSILKEVYEDGLEALFFEETNQFVYESIGLDKMIVIDITNPDDLSKAKEFYSNVVDNMEMEGIMVKPEKIYNKGVAPCLKVRNPRYLTIVYGPDYAVPAKFEKLIKKKGVSSKLKTSIKEFEIGKKMLETPYAKLEESNTDFLKIVAEMIIEEKGEKMLDPRL